MMDVFAIGKRGCPVRTIVQGEEAHAFLQVQDGEGVFQLTGMPQRPVMITSDGSDVVEIAPTLDEAKAAAWKTAKAIRTTREEAGCQTAEGLIQTDAASRANINAAAADALRWKMASVSTAVASVSVTAASSSWSRSWTMADNSVASFNADDMVGVANAVSAYLDAVHQASVAIRTKIFASKTVADVTAVDVTAGYPTK